MKFTQLAWESGDCTAPYFVTDYKAKTVGEFIKEVLNERSNEWGYISVGKHFYQSDIIGICEYRYGKLLIEMPQDVLDIEIKTIDASGGWSRMDYTINYIYNK